MTIDQAIEILGNIYMRGYKLTTKEHYDATKLGIEALKRINAARLQWTDAPHHLLLGETKD